MNSDAQEESGEVGAAAMFLHEGVLPVVFWLSSGAVVVPLLPAWQPGPSGALEWWGSVVLMAGLAVVLTGLARTVLRLWLLRLTGRRAHALITRAPGAGTTAGWAVAFRDESRRLWHVPLRTPPVSPPGAPGDTVVVTYERGFAPNVTTRSPGGPAEATLLGALTLTLAMLSAVALRIDTSLLFPG